MSLIEGYTRKSRALGDPDDPALLATHVDLIRRMAAEDGVELPPGEIYTEVGSGETIADRPTFASRLAYWESLPPGSGGRLYVPELARLSRGRMSECGRIQDALERAAILIRTPGRTWDLSRADDETYYRIETAMDRAEVTRYKERTARTRERQLREGDSRNGADTFGYLWNRKLRQYQPDPDRFPVLKAFLQDAFDLSITRVARKYCLPRHVVQLAVRCPIVCGWPAKVYADHQGTKRRKDNGEPWKKRYARLAPEDYVWPERPGNYEAAISREEFLRLQEVLKSRRKGQNSSYAPHGWCRDVVTFEGQPEGVPVRLGCWSNGCGKSWSTYEVPTPAPPLLYVRHELVHAAASAAVAAAWADPERVLNAVRLFREEEACRQEAARQRPAARDRERWEAELAGLRARLDDLILAEVGAAGERKDAFRRLAEKTEREIAEVRARLRLSLPEPDLDPELERHLARLPALFRDEFTRVWDREDFPDEERRAVVNLTLARIIIRVSPGENHRRFTREVVAVEQRPWMPPLDTASPGLHVHPCGSFKRSTRFPMNAAVAAPAP
jgi:hypothetical protein